MSAYLKAGASHSTDKWRIRFLEKTFARLKQVVFRNLFRKLENSSAFITSFLNFHLNWKHSWNYKIPVFWLKPPLELETFLKQLRRISSTFPVVARVSCYKKLLVVTSITSPLAQTTRPTPKSGCWIEDADGDGRQNVLKVCIIWIMELLGGRCFLLIAWACPQETRNRVEKRCG